VTQVQLLQNTEHNDKEGKQLDAYLLFGAMQEKQIAPNQQKPALTTVIIMTRFSQSNSY
jgi:hypothetical protein